MKGREFFIFFGINDSTIIDIKLKPLQSLVPKCEVVLIESPDLQNIQFKLVFKDKRKQLCGPDVVVEEQILLQFLISVKHLNMLNNQMKKKGESDSKANEAPKQLVFEECDGLVFDHFKFMALYAQMEKQKNIYNL